MRCMGAVTSLATNSIRRSASQLSGIPRGAALASTLVLLLAPVSGCRITSNASQLHHHQASIPSPRPVSTGPYQVGAYYFPGWPTQQEWKVLDAFPERTPLLGYYREGDPTVMDWQIKWAVEHGIAFFAFDWYWDRGRRHVEHALHEGYLRSCFRPYLKFCLLWANHNPPGSSSEADLLAVTDHWITHYFRRAEYLTLDGKPVIIVFSPRRLREDMGSEAVGVAIRHLRERMTAAGFPGLFLIGSVRADRNEQALLRAEGYDAGTGYNYPRAGMQDDAAATAPYDDAVDGYERIWNDIAQAGIIDYAPVAEPGWDSRPWDGDKALVRTGRRPEKFRDMLVRARAFADRHPIAGGKRLVLIEAWNEYGEGAVIEPHREWGFGYLDAIRSVFAEDRRPHRDLRPEDLGRSILRAP
jgi:Glycosyltransferase WbsX